VAAGNVLPPVVLSLSDDIWTRTRALRGRLHHGTRRCPQMADPFGAASTGVLCGRCSELHGETLLVIAKRLEAAIDSGASLATLRETARYRACRWTKDARDRLDSQSGLLVRPKRLLDRSWFVRAVPDAIDRDVVLDVLYFVRSGDDTGRYELPLERLGLRFGISHSEVAERIARAFASLRAADAAFVESNFDRPLMARVATEELA